MPEEFDPYRKWLGIAPSEQPAHHYRLLGIATFEDDPDVIQNAADRQMAHVRTFQGGPNRAHSQRILNELSAASIVLLDPARKAAYDAQLREQVSATTQAPAPRPAPPPPRREPVAAPPRVASEPVPLGQSVAPPEAPAIPVVGKKRSTVAARTRGRRKSSLLPMIVGLVAVGALLVGMLVFIVTQANESDEPVVKSPKSPAPASNEKNEKTDKPATPVAATGKNPGNKNKTDDWESGLPKPKVDPSKPPEEMPRAEKFKLALEHARTHLGNREIEQAKIALDNADFLQMNDADKNRARELRQLYGHIDKFWNGVREGIYKKSQPGDVITYKDDELEFLKREGEIVSYRFNDKDEEHSIMKLPAPVAVAFAQRGLAKNDPTSLVILATFWALDGNQAQPARRERAKQYWVEAAEEGEKDLPLAKELGLDEAYITSIGARPGNPQDDSLPKTELNKPAPQGNDSPLVAGGAPPSEVELRAAKERFKTRYADPMTKARNNAEQTETLLSVMANDAEAEKDPALKYLIFEGACDLAVDVVRVDMLTRLTDSMSQIWNIDGLQQKQRLLGRCRATTPMAAEGLLTAAEALLAEAEAAQRQETALAFGKMAIKAADKVKGKDIKPLQAKTRELEAYLDASDKALAGEEALAKNASDSSAHGNVGRFLCFFKRDFDTGLKHLAQSNVEDEKLLASDDLAQPTSADQQAQLAERWYQLAKKKAGVARQSCFSRSQFWLEKAAPQVSDDMKATVEKLQRELAKELDSA